jgi:hypothetical protein
MVEIKNAVSAGAMKASRGSRSITPFILELKLEVSG